MRARRGGDPKRVRSAAHALKGASGNLGARRVEALSARLEAGTEKLTPAVLTELDRELAVAKEGLRTI